MNRKTGYTPKWINIIPAILIGTVHFSCIKEPSETIPTMTNYTKLNGLANNYVHSIAIDSQDNKWSVLIIHK